MKYPIIFIFLFCSCVGYGQIKKDSVFYGLAGIKKSEPIDTQKIYFHKFIFFTEQMNKSTGRRSARFQDSAEFYYKKLYKK